MSMLTVQNLYKSYGEKVLFDHVSFSITARDRIGLIGVNGTGKSTLLKVLAGLDSAEEGEMQHAKDFRVEYLSQEPELDPESTVLEQIFQGDSETMQALRSYEDALWRLNQNPADTKLIEKLMNEQQKMDNLDAWDASTAAKTILTRLGIDEYHKKAGDLSGGQKKRVAIARALIQPADLLILDEPTNHLDNDSIEWMESYMPQYPGALILVTHDRYFLNRITNRIYELDKGNLYAYEGNYQTYLEKKAEREEQEILSEQKHKNTLKRELEWLRRGAKARTTKQKARIQRAEEMKDVKFNTKKEQLDVQIGANRLGKKVMEINGLTKEFEGKTIIENFDYLLVPGDRIGIIGPNGSGKTTLLNMMAGRVAPDAGEIDTGTTVKVGYYTQDHQEMDGEMKLIDYIRDKAEVVHTADGDVVTAEQMLERFLFPRSQQWTYIRKLSGGERRRLYLLRVLMEEPNVLFLDEPTNDLDTQTLGVLEDYLDNFPGVVVTVSHDRYFLDRVVDRLIAFEKRGVVEEFYGNFSAFKEYKKQAEAEQKPVKSSRKDQEKPKKKKKLSFKEQQEWNGIEERIMNLETEIEQAQVELTEAGNDLGKAQELYKRQEELETELEQAMERWEELSLLVEELDES